MRGRGPKECDDADTNDDDDDEDSGREKSHQWSTSGRERTNQSYLLR